MKSIFKWKSGIGTWMWMEDRFTSKMLRLERDFEVGRSWF